MKLSTLTLVNFRCFTAVSVVFHPQLTILVAENGQGKSTVLNAIRIALWPFVSSFDLSRTGYNSPDNAISIDDVRLLELVSGDMARQLPSIISMTGDFGSGQECTWSRIREQEVRWTKTKDNDGTKSMKKWAEALQDYIRNPENPIRDLPVFGYYGTGRLWAQKRSSENSKTKDAAKEKGGTTKTDFYIRTFAYRDCLDPASTFKNFKEWFTWAFESYRETQIKQLENRAQDQDVIFARERVIVVQQAINAILRPITGWHTLEYSVSHEKSLVLHHDQHGTLKVDFLSDGIRSVLAMVGDIAYRCVKLNPHLGSRAALDTNGVVLIDEVDMHLHPEWQQVVVGSLREAFPNIQFIVTTHSPQVLSTVRRENIRVIGPDNNGNLIAKSPLSMTYGEPSGDVMYSVMMVDPQPPVREKVDLQRLTELVDQGNYSSAEAIDLMSSLIEILGEKHPQLQRLQRSIKRQETLKI